MRFSIFKALSLATFILTFASFAQASDWGDDQPTPPPTVTYKGQKCQVDTHDSESHDGESYEIVCADKSFQPSRSCRISAPRSGGGPLTFSITTFKQTTEGDSDVRLVRSTKPTEFNFKAGSKGDLSSLLTSAMAERCGSSQAKFETRTIRSRDVDVLGHSCSYQVNADVKSVEHALICENKKRDQKCQATFTAPSNGSNPVLKGTFSQSFVDYSPAARSATKPGVAGVLKSDGALAELTKRLASCVDDLKESSSGKQSKSANGTK